jgi:hypothetical protein
LALSPLAPSATAAATDPKLQIGRHPIAAFDNSDGALQMLHWKDSGTGRRQDWTMASVKDDWERKHPDVIP